MPGLGMSKGSQIGYNHTNAVNLAYALFPSDPNLLVLEAILCGLWLGIVYYRPQLDLPLPMFGINNGFATCIK